VARHRRGDRLRGGETLMLLPFTSGLCQTNHFDPECAQLADRHYTRRKKSLGKRQFSTCARKLILRDAPGTVLFVWTFSIKRMDDQTGFNCAIFRNESKRRSSEIILEAERFAVAKWGTNRAFTFVDPRKVRSPNPGWCFIAAGWRKCGKTKKGKIILEKYL
jgi:hypothetical protein